MKFMSFIKSLFGKKQSSSSAVEADQENQDEKTGYPTLPHILQEFQNCNDLVHRTFPMIDVDVIYFGHLIGNEEFDRDVITPLTNIKPNEVKELLQRSQYQRKNDSKSVVVGILSGKVAIFYQEQVYLINVYGPAARSVKESETETVITGPHDAFVESAGTNLSLIRRRIKSSHLKVLKLMVGEITKTDVYLLYIKDIANAELIKKLQERIQLIEIDGVYEGNMLIQLIDEAPLSVFPQFITTERPDVVASKLASGKIIGIVDGSPSVFSAPTSFFEFFTSPDDYYQRWMLGTSLRLMRFMAFVITVSFTAFYVSVTTFHYEMIPEALLTSLAKSRARVPFPPIYEALLMETTIELLREAGARLPNKIGQTIGIVGGIVIGQAAVQAGLTSNILIIAVAISTIASFVIPSYIMSASIRLIRFGLIILAGMLGNLGLMIGVAMIIIHLCGLTNLGTSYLTPIAPMNFTDWKDTFIRAPFRLIKIRPSQSKSSNLKRNRTRV